MSSSLNYERLHYHHHPYYKVGYESQGPSRAENAELAIFSKLRSGVCFTSHYVNVSVLIKFHKRPVFLPYHKFSIKSYVLDTPTTYDFMEKY